MAPKGVVGFFSMHTCTLKSLKFIFVIAFSKQATPLFLSELVVILVFVFTFIVFALLFGGLLLLPTECLGRQILKCLNLDCSSCAGKRHRNLYRVKVDCLFTYQTIIMLICPESFFISDFDPCISQVQFFGPIFRQ